jgi:hypothetical protein
MEDLKKTAKSLSRCREIKNEILRFGINQLEIEQLIKLLALELENRNKMLMIIQCVEQNESSSILISEE